jgi:hypothetical protein
MLGSNPGCFFYLLILQDVGWVPQRVRTPWRRDKSLAPAGNQNGFLGGLAGSLFTIRFVNSHTSKLQSTFAPYCSTAVTVHISAVKVYEWLEMLTTRGVILT